MLSFLVPDNSRCRQFRFQLLSFSFVKRGVLTLVGEIRRYRNDRYYLLYRPSISVHIALHASSLQVPPEYEQDPMCQKFNATDIRRTYCGMVKALDEGVGKIIATLKELNVLDDFFLIFASDNGAADSTGASAWPLRGHKQTVYEVCKMWVLKGTHVQCMRFVNVCYRRDTCLLYTSPSPRDGLKSRMPSSA